MRGRPATPSVLWLKNAQERLAAPVAYGSLVFVLVVLYFGKDLGPWIKAAVPAAITIAVVFALATLQKIEQKIATIGESSTYSDVAAAVGELERIVSRDRETTVIKIIATTAGTTLTSVLPRLCRATPARRVLIELHVISEEGPLSSSFPPHWLSEVRTSMERAIGEYSGGRYRLRLCSYSNLPVVHGVMINGSALLIGFTAWSRDADSSPILSASDRPHTLYRRNDSDTGQLFWLFEDWLQFAPIRVVHESKESTGSG